VKVFITGANGFIGKNLQLHLAQRSDLQVVCFTRDNDRAQLTHLLSGVDFVFHLAGINRPKDPSEYLSGNVDLTLELCLAIGAIAQKTGKKVPIVYTSSTQANCDNPYGQSKRAAEEELLTVARSHQVPVHLFRLPNVFGKWSRPNYNSVVATFCYNIARNLPVQLNDPTAPITLLYIDDLIERFLQLMDGSDSVANTAGFEAVTPQYTTTVGDLARQIVAFKDSRETFIVERVGTGLKRALYATYVSHLPVSSFTYAVPQYSDPRGVFAEMLKTPDCGQFSYFTAHPGITRGGHYHHSKTEKFLVIRGQARFKFKHMQTGQIHELFTSGNKAEVVETVPGWAHDITNVGTDEMIVMLWANEIYDRTRPDTFACVL